MNMTANKAVTAAITQLVALVAGFGVEVDWITPERVMIASSVVTPLLVWYIPNVFK